MMAFKSVGQIPPGQHDLVLPPQCILMDIVRGSVDLTAVPQQQQPKSHMPSQVYANFWDLAESNPIPLPSIHGGEGSSFAGTVPPNDMAGPKAVVGIKPGYQCGHWYQVDEFTHTLLVEHFVGQSYIYPDVMGKVSALTQFPLEP